MYFLNLFAQKVKQEQFVNKVELITSPINLRGGARFPRG